MNNISKDFKTILIVDDNQENLKVLFDLLDFAGYNVTSAKSGEGALKLLSKHTPELILLDVMMPPGIDGFETCKRIKEIDSIKDIPIIFMTALSDPIDKIKGFEVGAVDYITKPFQIEEVLARVNTHITIQSLRKELENYIEIEKEFNSFKNKSLSILLNDIKPKVEKVRLILYLIKWFKLSEDDKNNKLNEINTLIEKIKLKISTNNELLKWINNQDNSNINLDYNDFISKIPETNYNKLINNIKNNDKNAIYQEIELLIDKNNEFSLLFEKLSIHIEKEDLNEFLNIMVYNRNYEK